MNLVEFEAKAMLRDAGLPVPRGTILDVGDVPVPDRRVVLKAQIAEGGRGRRGLIVPVEAGETENALELLRQRMRETGIRQPRVLAEHHVQAGRELYFAWCIDDVAQSISLLFSAQGGIDVEEHANSLSRLSLAVTRAPRAHEFVDFFSRSGFSGRTLAALCRFAAASWRVFVQGDMQLMEINPLAVTPGGEVVALDAKIVLDDNALSRHGEWDRLYSRELASDSMSPLERRAADKGFTFVELSGEVAVFAGGAGVGMAILDLLADAGMPAANFADASGGSGGEIFEELGSLTFELAGRADVKAILMYFTLAATSVADVVGGLLKLLDRSAPPKPLVVGLLTSGAAERDMTFERAQRTLASRGYRCERDLPGVIEALGEVRRRMG